MDEGVGGEDKEAERVDKEGGGLDEGDGVQMKRQGELKEEWIKARQCMKKRKR